MQEYFQQVNIQKLLPYLGLVCIIIFIIDLYVLKPININQQISKMSVQINQSKSGSIQDSVKQNKDPTTVIDTNREKKSESNVNPQTVFKYVCFFLIAILLFCIPKILEFRRYCQSVGYFVFPLESLKWCAFGFFFFAAIKYPYYHFCYSKFESIVDPKYKQDPQTLKRKTKFILKLTYDTFFYSFTSISAYILFSNEYFFPSVIGGEGSCTAIYKEYPNWPKGEQVRLNMAMYFMVQLGVHAFSVFQLIFIKGLKEHKFYETLLHHCIAVNLILFSMMSNQIAAGLIIVIIHDMSDILLACLRAYTETKFSKKYFIMLPLASLLFLNWVYLRIVIFPFCLLSNVFINKPTENDEWFMIYWEYVYLLTMAFVLYGMHIYWTYYMIKSMLKLVFKKEVQNRHERQKQG